MSYGWKCSTKIHLVLGLLRCSSRVYFLLEICYALLILVLLSIMKASRLFLWFQLQIMFPSVCDLYLDLFLLFSWKLFLCSFHVNAHATSDFYIIENNFLYASLDAYINLFKILNKGQRYSSLVEHLPNMSKAQGSSLISTK